jgi:hypothetical protein
MYICITSAIASGSTCLVQIEFSHPYNLFFQLRTLDNVEEARFNDTGSGPSIAYKFI